MAWLDLSSMWMIIGLIVAARSVTANDSVQTLGTFLSSNKDVKWYWLLLGASIVLWITLITGWYINDGDLSWGRLTHIPYPERFTFFHAFAPFVLLVLTRFGVPVSTTFLVLSVFASGKTLEGMVIKSMAGYGVAAASAFIIWVVLSKIIDELKRPEKHQKKYWIVAQWCATGFLWSQWLMHDMANIAVYLPRKVPLSSLLGIIVLLTFFLAYIFYTKGGKIQEIVVSKTSTRYIRSATIIDIVYAFILWLFKEWNNLPMSTTWVFVGLLAGRELAMRYSHKDSRIKTAFPIVTSDFLKVMIGLIVSVVIAIIATKFV